MANKRPYTFAEATASQKPEQSILTDSQKNGVKNIPATYFAKDSDLTAAKARITTNETDIANLKKVTPSAEFIVQSTTTSGAYSTARVEGKVMKLAASNGRYFYLYKTINYRDRNLHYFTAVDGLTTSLIIVTEYRTPSTLVGIGEEQTFDAAEKVDEKVESDSVVVRGEGELSVVENGKNNTASGQYSHAEGMNTTASGYCSHAEGENTKATKADCHAEGFGTEATKEYAHAEGQLTKSSGNASHAEGYHCVASGNHSHAEGESTIASYENQHVGGRYNAAFYGAEAIGNGNGEDKRKNIRTLDWQGNETISGKHYGNGNETSLEDQIEAKANESDMIVALDLKANASDVTTSLALKANSADVYTKGETYTKEEVESKLADKANTADVPVLDPSYTAGDYTKAATCASIAQAIAQATLDPSQFVVDQTYNANSTNAQSGVAVSNANVRSSKFVSTINISASASRRFYHLFKYTPYDKSLLFNGVSLNATIRASNEGYKAELLAKANPSLNCYGTTNSFGFVSFYVKYTSQDSVDVYMSIEPYARAALSFGVGCDFVERFFSEVSSIPEDYTIVSPVNLNISSTYSATGTQPVNGTAVASAIAGGSPKLNSKQIDSGTDLNDISSATGDTSTYFWNAGSAYQPVNCPWTSEGGSSMGYLIATAFTKTNRTQMQIAFRGTHEDVFYSRVFNGNSLKWSAWKKNIFIPTPPTSGTAVLKSVNGTLTWVTEE